MDPRETATAEALKDRATFANYRKKVLTPARQMTRSFTIETSEGTMDGAAGDWLCLDVKGNLYPCSADVFAASYELYPADDPMGS